MAVMLDFPTSEPTVTKRHLSLNEDLALPSSANFKCVSKTRSKTRSTVSALAINEAFLYKRELLDILLLCQHSSPRSATDVGSTTRPPSLPVPTGPSVKFPVCFCVIGENVGGLTMSYVVMIRDVMSLLQGSRKDRSIKLSRC